MTNTESYVRATIALIISFVALKFELWFLLIISAILLYTAYKKFCLMFSLLGINKKFSVDNYYYALLPQFSPFPAYIFNDDNEIVFMNNTAKEELGDIKNSIDLGIVDAQAYILEDKVVDTLFKSKEQTYQLHIRGIQKEKVLLVYLNNITKVLDLEYINASLEDKIESALNENELKNHLIVQQSKYVTTGELIENIGHQWKQPLSALNALFGSVQLRHSLSALSTDEMNEEMNRAARLVHIMNATVDDFRNFFKADTKKIDFSLESCLSDVILILGASLKQENIQVSNTINASICVRGYKNQFTQVLLNIMNNAKDALLETQAQTREIKISTAFEGNNVLLSICDTAGGISDEHMDKIFNSHFTTKEHKEGTGIGLHMSKIIIEKNMDGKITAENNDQGVCFVLTIPMQQIENI